MTKNKIKIEKLISLTVNHPMVTLFDLYRQFYHQKSDLNAAFNFLNDRIDNGESLIYIAYYDDVIAGFTQLYPSFSSVNMKKIYILNDLFTDENYRNKGIATTLLKHAEEIAKQNSIIYLALETHKDNKAQLLYTKNGWEKDNDYFHFTKNIKLNPQHT